NRIYHLAPYHRGKMGRHGGRPSNERTCYECSWEHQDESLVKIPVYCSPLWDTRIENMLDIRLIREKPDYVRERLATRDTDLIRQVDAVLEIDGERRRLETEMQRLSGERNRLSKEIGALRSKKESSSELENKVRTIGDDIAKLGGHVSAADE